MHSNDDSKSQQFGIFRRYLWPICKDELQKFVPLLFLCFLISFNYNILRNLKDPLLVTAKSSGAEVIPFVKVWMILPASFFLAYLYTYLCNVYGTIRSFYIVLSGFLLYFLFFALFLYPLSDQLHLHFLQYLFESYDLPLGLKGLVSMLRYWVFTSFYVMAELWSNMILSVLFWGLANHITRITEAKRFYGIIGFVGNLSGVVAGSLAYYLALLCNRFSFLPGCTVWQSTLYLLLFVVLASGLAILLIYKKIIKNLSSKDTNKYNGNTKIIKNKMSFSQSLKFIIRSKHALSLAVIVISYNLTINVLEIIWKDQVKIAYPSPEAYHAYMNQITIWTGIIASIMSLFVTTNAIRVLGWFKTAMMTPLVVGVTCLFFFSLITLDLNSSWLGSFSVGAFFPYIVFLGGLQNCFIRASKYSVFDATKEMAFIPLSEDQRIKAKSAIDGVGSRFGKSGGSLIHQVLGFYFTSIAATVPCFAMIMLAILGGWFWSVRKLSLSLGYEKTQYKKESLDLNKPILVDQTEVVL
tara:strand:- start:7 stop:1578 length:1572 start_codon:yes stop_codon:yes gene_type:complete